MKNKSIEDIAKNKLHQILTEKVQLLNEYARVGFCGPLEICVFTDAAGNIPYAHIRDAATRGHEFETCVRLDTNEYFLHGKHQGIFNNKECQLINAFMNAQSRNKKYQNNYEYAVDMWNDNNSSVNIEPLFDDNGRIIVPDYSKLNH